MKKGLLIPLAMGVTALASYSLLPTAYYRIKAKALPKKPAKKQLYLTFDDGPSCYTPELLELLKALQIKATFFTVADFASKYPLTIKQMADDGHLIANHSFNHKNAALQTPKETAEDFLHSETIMEERGIPIRYFRPPWGTFNMATVYQLKKHGYTPVLWQVMAEDWRENTTAEEIAFKLLSRTKNGDIICLHDGRGKQAAPLRTINALKLVLPIWKEQGYEFLTVDHSYA